MENTIENATFADLAGTMFVMLATIAYFYSESKTEELATVVDMTINFINAHGPAVSAGIAVTQNIPIAEADKYTGNTVCKCIEIVEATVQSRK